MINYLECPLYKRYEETRAVYLKEVRDREWRRNQRRSVRLFVDITIGQLDDPKREYWMDRVHNYLCRRMFGVLKTDWVWMIASLNDYQLGYTIHVPKMRRYCLMVRDEMRKAVEREEAKKNENRTEDCPVHERTWRDHPELDGVIWYRDWGWAGGEGYAESTGAYPRSVAAEEGYSYLASIGERG